MLRSLARLWLGVLLLAVALAPAADRAAGRSPVVDVGDLLLTLLAGALLGHATRWAFGRTASQRTGTRRALLAAAAVLAVAGPLLPLTFAQQVVVLAAGGVGGYSVSCPSADPRDVDSIHGAS